ncbi:hypothetical protein ASZ90_005768 [hydrocarbon metagenome]|uniref:SGNH/GDSL hydrolase family protein n=1 Tax=hydrocarbon metagenome TaxID=938273 RepID=A0A0W8FUB3_9ZZZZ
MKKILLIIVNIVILTAFWSLFFAPLYLISKKLGIGATAFITALYLLFLFISISYKYFWSFRTFKNKQSIIKFLLIAFISFLFLLYSANLVFRAHEAYKYLMSENRAGVEGVEYQADDILGFKPVPNAKVFETYITGDRIPIAYDSNGFRIPLSGESKINESNKTGLLFLGCSFTFGAGCYAEETFPYIVAKETNRSYINAGISSYGLAHMLILAEKLIPKYKPDYVIVQYSPWLVSRSVNMFAPVNFFSLPVPYFAERNNSIVLEFPVYNSYFKYFEAQQIKSLYKGKFLKFLFTEAVVFSFYEMWSYLKTQFLLITGQHLRPATNLREVERYTYNIIKTITEKNGATLIILNLGDIEYSKFSHSLFPDENVHFAEADSFLNDFLKTSHSKDYYTEFCHWKPSGKDNIIIDYHPNSKAHRLIANSIIEEINKTKNKKP